MNGTSGVTNDNGWCIETTIRPIGLDLKIILSVCFDKKFETGRTELITCNG